MKFTLTPNDKLKFKIFEKSKLFSDVTLIKNFRFYDSFNYWLLESKEYKRNNCSFYNTQLKIYKNKGEISYRLEDIQLIYRGKGNKSEIYKIEVNVKESTQIAKIKIFVERSYSFYGKIGQEVSSVFTEVRKRISQKKEQIAQKKKTDTKAIENIIKEKSNKTITDEY